MKKRALFCLLAALGGFALFAEGYTLSGTLDSTVNFTSGAGTAPAQSWGIEEFANLRLNIDAGEKGSVYAAVNLAAFSGNFLNTADFAADLMAEQRAGSNLAVTPLVHGQNYAAALELERLYFRYRGDLIDAEAGLLRLAFGYGQVWASSDFLNPRNPLVTNARPRGVLGADVSFYPADSTKLMAFAAAPKEPFESEGGGFLPGFLVNQDWDRLSLQALYSFETPLAVSKLGKHRFGLSLKADLELTFTADALYTLDPEKLDGIEGLSAGAGFDYSFFDGDLIVLFEYLYNGSSSDTAIASGGYWRNHHFLYGNGLYMFNDFLSLSFSALFCFDDLSFSPVAALSYELFQGFSLSLEGIVRLDQKTLNGGKAGELGPVPPYFTDTPYEKMCSRFVINAGAKLKF